MVVVAVVAVVVAARGRGRLSQELLVLLLLRLLLLDAYLRGQQSPPPRLPFPSPILWARARVRGTWLLGGAFLRKRKRRTMDCKGKGKGRDRDHLLLLVLSQRAAQVGAVLHVNP